MKRPTIEKIHEVMQSNGMHVFTKPFSITLGGIRTKDTESNTFNDWLFASFPTRKGGIVSAIIEATTDAGLYYRETPMNTKGTSIIQHGKQYGAVYQYQNPAINSNQLGHKGKEAFRQIRSMDYWRDSNYDSYLDCAGKTYTENAQTNIHDMGTLGNEVNKWSAGCCGSTEENMDVLYGFALIQKAAGLGDIFSFAMLHENMF